MSVAEFPSQQGPGEFTRTPPQDVVAEQSVLGGMLLSKDAIADVVEAVRGHDFYRPAHELVFDAVLDLYGRGEPADAVTVSAELQKRGELARVGGAPYLHTLISSVPTAANAGYYARIVRESAVLRRLIEAGTKIVQMGYNGDGEADDIVDAAQAEVYNVTDKRTSEDYLPLSAIMEGTLDEIEAIGSRGGEMVGVPTGFQDFDELTNGLHPGQMIVVAARPAVGKALALDTPLPTPGGWTTMGQVAVGDRLIGADGRATTVVEVTDVLTDRPCYEVEFSDGTVIVADAAHQWLTGTLAPRTTDHLANVGAGAPARPDLSPSVKTTEEIARTVRSGDQHDRRFNHTVTLSCPLDLPLQDLPLPPYALGVWTAERHASSGLGAPVDDEVALFLDTELSSLPTGHVGAAISSLDLAGAAHLPSVYLRSAISQRRALLAGLLDAAATVRATTGSIQLSLTDEALALDVRELVVSLGYACSDVHTSGADPSRLGCDHPPTDVLHRRRRVLGRQQAGRPCRVPRRSSRSRVVVLHRGGAPGQQRARSLRRGRQRKPPLPRRSDDDPDPQLHAGTRHRPFRRHQEQPGDLRLLARDEPQRDHHAPALRRGARASPPHAHRQTHRR